MKTRSYVPSVSPILGIRLQASVDKPLQSLGVSLSNRLMGVGVGVGVEGGGKAVGNHAGIYGTIRVLSTLNKSTLKIISYACFLPLFAHTSINHPDFRQDLQAELRFSIAR